MSLDQEFIDYQLFYIRVAGITVGIKCRNASIYKMCKPFIVDSSEQSSIISVDYHDVMHENEYINHKPILIQGQYKGVSVTVDIGQLESLAILRRLSNYLIEKSVLLMHGAAVALDDTCYLFTAPPGTGKTTHIVKWLEHIPKAVVVNGDKPFIKFCKDGTVLSCGSPWAGKENLYTDIMVPLKSIVIMERAKDNRIDRITFADAFPLLLQQVHHPKDVDNMRRTLQLMQLLPLSVTFWRFKCNNFKQDCFDVAYKALVGKQYDKH